MDIRRARQIIKQNSKTIHRMLAILEKGPADDMFLYQTLCKQGGKDSAGTIKEYLTALTAAHRIAQISKGVYQLASDGELPGHGPIPTKLANVINEDTQAQLRDLHKPKEAEPMIDMTPEAMRQLSQQLAEMAEMKSREMDPALLDDVFAATDEVLAASDRMKAAADNLRRSVHTLRKATGYQPLKVA